MTGLMNGIHINVWSYLNGWDTWIYSSYLNKRSNQVIVFFDSIKFEYRFKSLYIYIEYYVDYLILTILNPAGLHLKIILGSWSRNLGALFATFNSLTKILWWLHQASQKHEHVLAQSEKEMEVHGSTSCDIYIFRMVVPQIWVDI